MRINSIPPQDLLNRYINIRERVTIAPERSAGTDKVEFTSDAKTFSASLKAAREALASRSPEEQARIGEVAEQIRNNTYSVPGYKVAEKILGR